MDWSGFRAVSFQRFTSPSGDQPYYYRAQSTVFFSYPIGHISDYSYCVGTAGHAATPT